MTAKSSTLSDRALKRALAAIQDDDEVARFEAAKTLSTDPAAFDPLRKLLPTTTRPENRLPIVYALSWQSDLRGWALFIRILGDPNESAAVRSQAAEGLAYNFHRKRAGASGFRAAIESLTAALTDPSPDVRYYAAFALGASGERAAIPALRKVVKDRATSKDFVGTVGGEARDAIERIGSGA